MRTIEQLNDSQVQGLLKNLSKGMEPQKAANTIMFYLSGHRFEEGQGLNLKRSSSDETVATDLRFVAEVARDVVPEYENVVVEGSEPYEAGETIVRLER